MGKASVREKLILKLNFTHFFMILEQKPAGKTGN